ncbi:hypothetical protein D3C80_1500840 [compost metagenome]
MEIHANPKIRSYSTSDSRYSFYYLVYLVMAIDILHFLRGIHLDRCKAGLLFLQRSLSNITRTISANPGIYAHRFPAGSAKQLIYGCIEVFPLDIP